VPNTAKLSNRRRCGLRSGLPAIRVETRPANGVGPPPWRFKTERNDTRTIADAMRVGVGWVHRCACEVGGELVVRTQRMVP
jgi:hypothetical protein